MIDRVLVRLTDEHDVNTSFINESITTVSDRLKLRLGTDVLPEIFNSIVVDAVVKMYRRQYYEGIQSENIDTISTTFIDNILSEYELEITSYIDKENNVGNVVKFI